VASQPEALKDRSVLGLVSFLGPWAFGWLVSKLTLDQYPLVQYSSTVVFQLDAHDHVMCHTIPPSCNLGWGVTLELAAEARLLLNTALIVLILSHNNDMIPDVV